MARKTSTKRRGGRVTPRAQESAGRYTPPIPREQKVSPGWVPALMFTCLGVGVLVILANYVGLMPGGEANNWYLLIGLGLITAGFLTATQYR